MQKETIADLFYQNQQGFFFKKNIYFNMFLFAHFAINSLEFESCVKNPMKNAKIWGVALLFSYVKSSKRVKMFTRGSRK